MNQPNRKLEFTGYLSQSHSRLFAYVHSLVRDLNDADDIVQKTAVILWEKFDTYDRQQSFISWACGIARFEVLNFVRKKGRERLSFSEDIARLLAQATEEKSALLEAREDALVDCLRKLPEKKRELVNACYLNDATIEEAARVLNRSTHSIYNSLRRIRQQLFECVSKATQMEFS